MSQRTEAYRPLTNESPIVHFEPSPTGKRCPVMNPNLLLFTAGEVEKKVALDRSTTEPPLTSSSHTIISSSSSSHPLSKSTPSSLTSSAARKTHHSVLPPHLKFYGTTEYKDQFTNKGVISEGGGPHASSSSSHQLAKRIVSSEEEKKLTTKKLKEQSLTEQRSNFIWPSKYLYHQHHVRPNHHPPTAETSLAASTASEATVNVSRSGGSNGNEEMKTIEENRTTATTNTQKSLLIDTDSIGSRVREFSNTDHSDGMKKSTSTRERMVASGDLAKKWTPSRDLGTTTDRLGEF
jgi:hypothetical protein